MVKSIFLCSLCLGVALAHNINGFQNRFLHNNILLQEPPIPIAFFDTRSSPIVNVEQKPTFEYVADTPAIIVPQEPVAVVTEVVSKPALLPTFIYNSISVIKSAIWFLITNSISLIVSTVIALGICKFSMICNSSNFQDIHNEVKAISSFATPETLNRAVDFLRDAFGKYHTNK